MKKPNEKIIAGALDSQTINHTVRVINTSIESAKNFTDASNETVNEFGSRGGNKSAIRLVARLKRMETKDAQDFLRCFEQYVHASGIWDQIDMLDQMNEQKELQAA
jgi:hypothetical protein